MCQKITSLFTFVFFLLLSNTAFAQNVTVDINGSGNYTSVQAAIDAAPTGQTSPYVIYIKNGKYREKVNVPSNKPFIQLVGQSVANTIIYYDDNANTVVNGAPLGTQNSASVTINASDFSAFNITFANTAGDVGQAVAVLVNADRAAFKNCRFLGNQDTLYTKGSGTPRAYFLNCYIDGNTDFIFGSTAALFDSCIVYAKIKSTTSTSYITAPNTPTGQAYGYTFRNAKISGNAGADYYFLSRPWASPSVAATAQKVVLINAVMSNTIKTAGWSVWDANTDTNNVYNAEYHSKYDSGLLVDTSLRVSWSHQLTTAQVASYALDSIFGASWSPCTLFPNFCTYYDTVFAVSNFKGSLSNSSSSAFSWNMSWPKDSVVMKLYRSTSLGSGYTVVDSSLSTTANYNYSFTDTGLASGVYYYFLKASKAGYATQFTDTVMLQNQPNLSSATTTLSLSQFLGSPSSNYSYTLTGASLIGNVTVTPPANFEVSADGANWSTSSSPLTITPTAGAVNSVIYVRLNAASVGTHTGNITNTSSGSNTVSVALSGSTTIFTAPTNYTLIAWPMAQGNTDSASIRYAGVAATVPVFNNFYSSNGTAVPAIPNYSTVYGQAFGCSSNGDGRWGTSAGGPGGNLNRMFYEEFTVTANTGYSMVVDSFNITAAFYNTSSNTKMAVVYSLSNFTSDSADVSGGIGIGAVLSASANGGFTTPVILANQTAGPTNAYSFALNGSTGVAIPTGGTLKVRVYFSCGSSSVGRYAMVKNVSFIGYNSVVTPVELLSFNAQAKTNSNIISWTTANEKNIASFELQKSMDGTRFENITTVKAGNNASGSYEYEDFANREVPVIYYRLKINELDNSSYFSNTLLLRSDRSIPDLKLYPNPATDRVYFETGLTGEVTVQLHRMDGRLIRTITGSAEELSTGVDVSNLAQGVYLISLTSGGEQKQSVIVKH